MLVAPEDLDEDELGTAVRRAWGIDVASMSYRPVGWGSHHWEVTAAGRQRYFVTVDELENKRVSGGESVADGFARLRASLRTAIALKDAGRGFVVAPVPVPARECGTPASGVSRAGPVRAGEPAVRFGGRFAVAVYPFVEGRSFRWGEWTAARRSGVLGMVTAVHRAPAWVRREALTEDFVVPFRDQAEAAMNGWDPGDRGPYARRVAGLLRANAASIGHWLDRYDRLAAVARQRPERNVLTHGEPHPGNAMLTADGWRLIDWDTALVAPPERDLWHLDDGEGGGLDAYAEMTGIAAVPELIELYRMGWDIKDMAHDAARFFRPHSGTADDAKSWELLSSLVRRLRELPRGGAARSKTRLRGDLSCKRAYAADRSCAS